MDELEKDRAEEAGIRPQGVIHNFIHLSQEETHLKGLSPSFVAAELFPFQKGIALHCLIDEVREKIVEESGIYDLIT